MLNVVSIQFTKRLRVQRAGALRFSGVRLGASLPVSGFRSIEGAAAASSASRSFALTACSISGQKGGGATRLGKNQSVWPQIIVQMHPADERLRMTSCPSGNFRGSASQLRHFVQGKKPFASPRILRGHRCCPEVLGSLIPFAEIYGQHTLIAG